MKLSIIIPMYKVERYIEKCLYSCINQGMTQLGAQYEIVCINDGTPDLSAEIARRIASEHPGIRVIDQENQGLSGARNTGIENANGEYVWFVDSDDTIVEKCLDRILPQLTDGIDILHLRYRHTYEDGTPNKDFVFEQKRGVYSGSEVLIQGGLDAPAQFSIFRREFLNRYNLCFVKGIYHEDSEFKPRATYFASKIAFDTDVSYNYLQRQSGSIMSSFSLKRATDVIFVNRSLYDFSRNFNPDVVRAFNSLIAMNMNSLLAGYHLLDEKQKSDIKTLLKGNKDFFSCMKNTTSFKYRLEGVVFSMSVELGLMLHRLIK